MRAYSMRLIVVVALVALSCTQEPRPEPVRGLADFHSHQFAELGFGRALLTHGVDPNGPCLATLTFDDKSFRLQDLVRRGLANEAAKQAASGICAPTATNRAGQQMDTENLKRAWQYGLRLMVMFAVNSEFLCMAGGFPSSCPEVSSIEAQLRAARALEEGIDAAEGGPGRGWYRVVETPEHARSVINDGKLAVVLGVETSNAFGGCTLVGGGMVPGVPPIVGVALPEVVIRQNCGPDLLPGFVSGGLTSRAIALLEHYRSLGARHFYLVHNVPGIAGGHSLSIPLLHAANNPAERGPGSPFDRVVDINRVIVAARLPIQAVNCGSFAFDGGRCNSEGLSGVGIPLARAMASYGSVIDIDHLSLKAKRQLRGEVGLGTQYPVVSSHSGFNEINNAQKSNEDQLVPSDVDDIIKWEGALGPILLQGTHSGETDTFPAESSVVPHVCGGTSEGWVQAYRYAVARLRATSLYTGEPAFVGVGFGSDFNGLAGWPRPRFSDPAAPVEGYTDFEALFVGPTLTPTGGGCYSSPRSATPSQPRVNYPFTSPMTSATFDRSTAPWSGRTQPYDISYDGVAHVGMIPDFVEELRVMGLSDSDLEPLWHGAEAYIRTWEAAINWSSGYGTEVAAGIEQECRAARGALVAAVGSGTTAQVVQQTADRWNQALAQLRSLGCYGAVDAPAPS